MKLFYKCAIVTFAVAKSTSNIMKLGFGAAIVPSIDSIATLCVGTWLLIKGWSWLAKKTYQHFTSHEQDDSLIRDINDRGCLRRLPYIGDKLRAESLDDDVTYQEFYSLKDQERIFRAVDQQGNTAIDTYVQSENRDALRVIRTKSLPKQVPLFIDELLISLPKLSRDLLGIVAEYYNPFAETYAKTKPGKNFVTAAFLEVSEELREEAAKAQPAKISGPRLAMYESFCNALSWNSHNKVPNIDKTIERAKKMKLD